MNNEVVYVYMIREQEKKLRELMGDAEYSAFAEEIAKGAFKAQVESMAPGASRITVSHTLTKSPLMITTRTASTRKGGM